MVPPQNSERSITFSSAHNDDAMQRSVFLAAAKPSHCHCDGTKGNPITLNSFMCLALITVTPSGFLHLHKSSLGFAKCIGILACVNLFWIFWRSLHRCEALVLTRLQRVVSSTNQPGGDLPLVPSLRGVLTQIPARPRCRTKTCSAEMFSR